MHRQQSHLSTGRDSDSSLQQIIVFTTQVTLEGDLGVGVEVGVRDAGPGYPGDVPSLRVSWQI